MAPCKACEGTGTVRAVNPRTGERDDAMPRETCPDCGGGSPGFPPADEPAAEPEPEGADEPEEEPDEDE